MKCDYFLWGLCLTKSHDTGASVFGFPEFLTAFALLALAFSASDPLYRFKVEIAPIPLRLIAFVASVMIGVGSLLTDLWFARGWYSLPWGWSRAGIQAALAAIFLTVILLWLWFAFVAPASFGLLNYKRFNRAVFRRIVRGSEVDLAVVADQIPYAAKKLIALTMPPVTGRKREIAISEKQRIPLIQQYAHDTLWLLGSRKFCRVVMASSPHTAIAICSETSLQKRWDVPLSSFVQNITLEAILNSDSQIYHEDQSSLTNVFGYLQPFTTAVYGDYKLLEQSGGSMTPPLDLDWQIYHNFTATQWDAYCRITIAVLEGFVATCRVTEHSYLLSNALNQVRTASYDTYLLNGATGFSYDREVLGKLEASVNFVRNAMSVLNRVQYIEGVRLRISKHNQSFHERTIFDDLTELLYQLILNASAVEQPEDVTWTIHYNTVWSPIFNSGERGPAYAIVLFKLRRRLFDEIKAMQGFPNFEGARILAFALNVIPFEFAHVSEIDRPWLPFGKAVIRWTQRNYLSLRQANTRVGDACLIGRVTFDPDAQAIVKTYLQGLRAEPPRVTLALERQQSRSGRRQG